MVTILALNYAYRLLLSCKNKVNIFQKKVLIVDNFCGECLADKKINKHLFKNKPDDVMM